MTTVERILAVVRGHRPASFTDATTHRGELLAALAIDGLDVRGDCRTFGGRVDLLVAHLDTVGVLVWMDGLGDEPIDESAFARRLRRLADGGDLDALILLLPADRKITFSPPPNLPIYPVAIRPADASPEAFAA